MSFEEMQYCRRCRHWAASLLLLCAVVAARTTVVMGTERMDIRAVTEKLIAQGSPDALATAALLKQFGSESDTGAYALAARALPTGAEWQYEPKWDGFRCLARRERDTIELQSKSGQPLARYFPDIVAALEGLGPRSFLLDGELVVPVDGDLSFNELQLRLHPAASRVRMLASRHPALYIVFDLLEDERGKEWLDRPLRDRR